jgi:hypothetical protein
MRDQVVAVPIGKQHQGRVTAGFLLEIAAEIAPWIFSEGLDVTGSIEPMLPAGNSTESKANQAVQLSFS